MAFRDRDLSLQYLQILEERLHIEWNASGQPVFRTTEVNEFTIQRIKGDLTDLLSGITLDNAIVDAADAGRRRVQGVGFGLVEDFNRFVKLGYLCNERVVLWDFIWGRILDNLNELRLADLELLGEIACGLLLLRPIVEDNGLVILPHPYDWHERTRRAIDSIENPLAMSTEDYGLLAAVEVIDDGALDLHPYTLTSSNVQRKIADGKSVDVYSPAEMRYHSILADLFIEDEKLWFLDEISAASFYEIITQEQYQPFYRHMQDILADPTDLDRSLTRLKERGKQTRGKLVDMIRDRNGLLRRAKAAPLGAAIGLSAIALKLPDLIGQGAPILQAMAWAGAAGAAALNIFAKSPVRLFSRHSDKTIFLQAFHDMERVATNELLRRRSFEFAGAED